MARSVKRTVASWGFWAALLAAGPAPAEEAPGAAFFESALNEQGQRCQRRAEHRDARRVLVACGAAGVWEVALEEAGPRFVKSHAFTGEAVGFFTEADGRLWVKLLVLEARPFGAESEVAPGAAQFPSAAPAAAKEPDPAPLDEIDEAEPERASPGDWVGRVVHAAPGEVVISLGSRDGITRGDRIEFAVDRPEAMGGGEAALSRETLAVGVVTHVTEKNAKVRLGLNEAIPAGAVASLAKTPLTASLVAPPLVPDVWAAEVMLRPFAALERLGGGILLSAAFSRSFKHLHLRALVDPLAYAAAENGESVSAVSAALLASYDSKYFEMGLGFGAQTVNETTFLLSPGSGLSVAQLLRLGSRDGLNVMLRTSVVLFHKEFRFGGMVGSMQIPLTRGYWLLFGGGGGVIGYGQGELGLRALLSGNGHAGSKYLTVTAGGAAVFTSGTCDEFFACSSSSSYGGPMAGVGGEWRF